MTIAFIGIGSNLQDPARQVEQAVVELDALPHSRLVKRSSLYRSAPVGYAAQPDFVNAVAQLETGMPAERLLGELQAIESRHGRSRSFANAPRTLDLDMLLYGTLVVKSEKLEIPHPRMHERAFVLQPLLEIAPQLRIPGHGGIGQCLRACAGQSIERIA